MRVTLIGCALLMLLVGCNGDNDRDTTPLPPDNTGVNERDADGHTKTPLDQSNDQSDIDLVAKIRAEVLEIDDLSTNGKNVKIITNNGKAVLRGPVDSAAERAAIVQVAEDIAGAANVTDQLEIETD